MAILFITHKFPPSIGGMQKQSYELINGMRKHTTVYTIIQSPIENKLWFMLRLKSRIKTMLKNNPDITSVHCNDGVTASVCSWLTNYNHIHITATLHGLDISFPNQLFQQYIVPRLRKFDKIFAVSRATALKCYEKGFNTEQVVTIPNGVEHEMANDTIDPNFIIRFKKEYGIDLDKDKVLLSIGRPVPRKGFYWFAKEVLPKLDEGYTYIVVGPSKTGFIMSRILKILPIKLSHQIKLAIGYPSDAVELKKLNSPSFLYLDQLPYPDLVQLLLHAMICLMPNIRVEGDMEGFGLVALEASLRRTFVIASDIEGISCAVKPNENGYLLPTEKAAYWAEVIMNLCRNADLVRAKSEKAQDFVLSHYSWDIMVSAYKYQFDLLEATVKENYNINQIAIA